MTDSRKWLAVVNPTSGGGRTKSKWIVAKRYLDKLNIHYKEVESEYVGHAMEIVQKELTKYDGVIAVGGDGTVNEVLNGLLQTSNEKVLTILPTGTGNDLANTFQMPLDLKEACKTILFGKPRLIDVGYVIGKDFNGNSVRRYFGGVASFGFDADVPYQTNSSSKRLPGTWNYIRAIIKNLIQLSPKKFLISYKNESGTDIYEEELLLCAIGNGKFYGGGMMIVPPASVIDGKFHIATLKPVSKVEFIKVFPSVYTGEHVRNPAVYIFDATELVIRNPVKTRYQVDGEVLGYTPVKVKIIPKRLKILCPRKLPDFNIKK